MEPTNNNQPETAPQASVPQPSPIGYSPNASSNYAQAAVSTVPDIETPPIEPKPQPVAGLEPDAPFVFDKDPKKSYKKLFITIAFLFVGVISLLGVTSFAMYYNNPDKVLLDALSNLIKQKTVVTNGTIKLTDKPSNSTVSIDFSTQSNNPKYAGSLEAKVNVNYQNVKVNLSGAGMETESGELYFRIDNASELLDQSLQTDYGKQYASQPELAPIIPKLQAFVEKIDGHWIRIDKSDFNEFMQDYDKMHTCMQETMSDFYSSNDQQQEVVKTMSDYNFVNVKSASKSQTINGNASAGYDISFDIAQYNLFTMKYQKTAFAKAIDRCMRVTPEEQDQSAQGMSKEEIKGTQEELDKLKTTVWVSNWGHALQRVDMRQNDKAGLSLDASVNFEDKQPNLKDPEKHLEFKDVMKEFQDIYSEATAAYSTSSSSQILDDQTSNE